MRFSSRIIGSGSVLPVVRKENKDFWNNSFYDNTNNKLAKSNDMITAKFEEVSGIFERRVAEEGINASHLGAQAAQAAHREAHRVNHSAQG